MSTLSSSSSCDACWRSRRRRRGRPACCSARGGWRYRRRGGLLKVGSLCQDLIVGVDDELGDMLPLGLFLKMLHFRSNFWHFQVTGQNNIEII